MKKRGLMIVILLTICLLATACKNPLLRPQNESQDIKEILQTLEMSIKKEEWSQATQQHQRLEKAWKQLKTRVSINAAQDDVNDFEHEMAHLKGYIQKKNVGEAMALVYGLQAAWESLRQF